MPTSNCCDLVSNFTVSLTGCILSVNTSSRAEFMKLCEEEVLTGPVIGTLSMTAHATDSVYVGCPANAGVTIPWISKYDCDNDIVHFLFGGEGTSHITGDVGTLATQRYSANRRYKSINANSGGGPAALVQNICREEGYGLTYNGLPIAFDTSNESTLSRSSFVPDLGAVNDIIYLQSFNLELIPGNFPTASYSYVFVVGSDSCS